MSLFVTSCSYLSKSWSISSLKAELFAPFVLFWRVPLLKHKHKQTHEHTQNSHKIITIIVIIIIIILMMILIIIIIIIIIIKS